MNRLSKAVLAASIALTASQKGAFQPRPASSYPARQTSEGVTIAVEPYDEGDKVKQAFGKTNLGRLGILPILVVIANDTDQALHLDRLRITWITADRQKIEPTPGDEVHLGGPVRRPDLDGVPRSPIPGVGGGRKKPEASGEIRAREFQAPVAPPRGTVHGFFYFRTGKSADRIPGSQVYITGIRNAATGKDLLYFEISLDPYVKRK